MTVPSHDGWGPCPAGEFERLGRRLGASRARRWGIGLTLATALTAATGVATYAAADWARFGQPAPASCCPAERTRVRDSKPRVPPPEFHMPAPDRGP